MSTQSVNGASRGIGGPHQRPSRANAAGVQGGMSFQGPSSQTLLELRKLHVPGKTVASQSKRQASFATNKLTAPENDRILQSWLT